eukprot:12920496-Alexandrium_andersonii.AAC.1
MRLDGRRRVTLPARGASWQQVQKPGVFILINAEVHVEEVAHAQHPLRQLGAPGSASLDHLGGRVRDQHCDLAAPDAVCEASPATHDIAKLRLPHMTSTHKVGTQNLGPSAGGCWVGGANCLQCVSKPVEELIAALRRARGPGHLCPCAPAPQPVA